jgi:hypothetical protein
VVAKLMRLPQIGAAEAALAADTGVDLESISQVSGAKVIQEGVYITVEGTAQGAVGVAMAGRGNFPSDQTDSATQATAHDGREPGTTTTAGEAGPGEWVADAKESMPENSRSYQSQVTGKPPRSAYKVRGVKLPNGKVTDVKFDGFIPGEEFQECKGPGYADFLDKKRPGRFQWWFEESQKAESGMVTQAKRQLEVAKGRLPVRWYVAEREVADAIRRLLEANNAGEVEVIYRPFLPGKGVK